jgi:hypothetical protein
MSHDPPGLLPPASEACSYYLWLDLRCVLLRSEMMIDDDLVRFYH